MTDQPQRAGRSAVIDAFRLGGVLYIVGYFHLPWYVSYVPGIGNPLVKAAVVLALGLFVLVSGYLLGNTDRSGQWVTRFYRRRFVRIYVPFVLTSIVFLAMSLEDLATFAKSIFLVAMFLPPPPLTLWFVTMIGLFYVLAPVLITASERPVGLLLIAAATMAALLIYHGLWRLDPRIAIYFPDFAAGIYFSRRALPRSPVALVALVALAALSVVPVWLNRPEAGPAEFALEATPCALLAPLAVFTVAMRFAGQFRSPPVLSVLGEASFFIYLLHRPIYRALTLVWQPREPPAQATYILLIGLPLVVAASVAALFITRRLNFHRAPLAASRSA
ncbi:MAG TPA: acyltransferase [Stellaceae bacterium]